MLKKGLLAVLVGMILLGMLAVPVQAQTYLFQVGWQTVDLWIDADGTAFLEYYIQFINDPSADPIEYVDLGLPNRSFDLNSVVADVDGQSVSSIVWADPDNLEGSSSGITLELENLAIQPGQEGVVHIIVPGMGDMLYPGEDESRPDYASLQFSPNYFGSRYVQGETDLTVTIHLPPGVQPDESVYYRPSGWPGSDEPESAIDADDRIYFQWNSPSADASERYVFGAGFPAQYVPAGTIQARPAVNFDVGGELVCVLCFFGFFVLIFGLVIYESIWGAKKRKMKYLPPKIAIEGHGIKRGLTAVEAAILMEQPMDKILTMILFSVIKKGAAEVATQNPLELQNLKPDLEGLQPYETDFLAAFAEKQGAPRMRALKTTMIGLIKSITERMKGFSHKETVAYYNSIVEKAWGQVTAAATPEVKSQKFDEVMDWTMLDRDYAGRTQEVFRTGPIFVPTWYPRYDPVYRTQTGFPTTGSTGQGLPNVSLPNLPNLPGSDFAASVVNGVQNFSSGVIGDLTAFTGSITNQTNPPPVSRSSGSSGGGGRSCACACACAGCACACAGGGR